MRYLMRAHLQAQHIESKGFILLPGGPGAPLLPKQMCIDFTSLSLRVF